MRNPLKTNTLPPDFYTFQHHSENSSFFATSSDPPRCATYWLMASPIQLHHSVATADIMHRMFFCHSGKPRHKYSNTHHILSVVHHLLTHRTTVYDLTKASDSANWEASLVVSTRQTWMPRKVQQHYRIFPGWTIDAGGLSDLLRSSSVPILNDKQHSSVCFGGIAVGWWTCDQ